MIESGSQAQGHNLGGRAGVMDGRRSSFGAASRRRATLLQGGAVSFLLLLLALSAAVALPRGVAAQGALVTTGSQALQHSRNRQLAAIGSSGDGTLIVTLLDGRVVAVDREAGRVLWTFDSGTPLVSAKQSPQGSGFNVFPGADGGLYAYHGMTKAHSPGLERLPLSLPELVQAAPSLTADGSLIVGRRESRVFVLDRSTGQPLATLTADGAERVGTLAWAGLSATAGLDAVLLVGRQDYTVRSLRVDTQVETWNATFARMHLLQPSTGAAGVASFLEGGSGGAEALTTRPGSLQEPDRLVVGADNSLQAFDGTTGFKKWGIDFGTPPISAFASGANGGSAPNLLMPPAHVTGATLPYGPYRKPSTSTDKIKGSLAGGTSVLIGALRGSLYALPADHLLLDATAPAAAVPRLADGPYAASKCTRVDCLDDSTGAASPLGIGYQPGAPLIGAEGECRAGEDDGGALVVRDDDSEGDGGLVPLQPSGDGIADELGGLVCPHLPPGLYRLSDPAEGRPLLPWLPDSVQQSPEPANLTGWFVSRPGLFLMGSLIGLLTLAVLLLAWKLYGRGATLQQLPAVAKSAAAVEAAAAGALTSAQQGSGKATGKGKKGKLAASKAAKLTAAAAAAAAGAAASGTARGATSTIAADSGSQETAAPNGRQQRTDEQQQEEAKRRQSAEGSQQQQKQQQQQPESRRGDPQEQQQEEQQQHASNTTLRASSADSAGLSSDAPTLRSYVDDSGAVVIGRLRVGPGVLGYGSAGTIVYEGSLDGRQVAVKRLLRQFYDLARKEIQVLIVSDEHPNVVRCFAMEEDREFVYLALEKCRCTLSDWVSSAEGQAALLNGQAVGTSPQAMSLLSDVASGLSALHARAIVHRDLKPHNVLITESCRAKLSDMGLSKQLVAEQSSFESHGAGGSSGWQAPEQLIARSGGAVRQTRSMDIFSLGCVVHYTLTGGRHPYGDGYERDGNIMRGAPNLSALASSPEAVNMVGAMLSKAPAARPTMAGVMAHPFWWSVERRLQFLVDVSDRVEFEDREPDQSLLTALETFRSAAIGPTFNWGAAVEPELIVNLGKYRRYDYTSLRDLLRVVRNKKNHFREMPEVLQRAMGPVPEGYYRYFNSRFPDLLMAVFVFAATHLVTDEHLSKYWPDGAQCLMPFCKRFRQGKPMGSASSVASPAKGSQQQQPSQSQRAIATKAAAGGQASGKPPVPPPQQPQQQQVHPSPARPAAPSGREPLASTAWGASGANGRASTANPGGAVGGKTTGNANGSGSFSSSGTSGDSSGGVGPLALPSEGTPSAAQPAAAAVPSAAAQGSAGPVVVVGYEVDGGEEPLQWPSFPRRSGQQPCEFYVKTGTCRYGQDCCFDHPAEYAVPLTEQQLPYRKGEPICAFYLKTQQCKFGAACKFHHPKLRPIFAGSALSAPAAT